MNLCVLFVLTLQACTTKQEPAVVVKPSPEHLIGNLSWQDTLVLSAKYSECGEYGGHREMIKLYVQRDIKSKEESHVRWRAAPLTAAWFVDTTNCYQAKKKFFMAEQRVITIEEEAVILQYMQGLFALSLRELTGISNACNSYSVEKQRKNSYHSI